MEAPLPIEELRELIETFLLEHSRPLLSEPGRDVIDLGVSSYSFSTQHDKLVWHVWNENTNVVRQITGIQKRNGPRLELCYQRFGKGPPGTLVLSDSRARPDQLDRRSRRTQFLRRLRRCLAQLFPEWKVEELTTEADLARSFSGRYTRGLIHRGRQGWAIIGCGGDEDPAVADDILASGILWLDWLRQKNPHRVIEGLKIFLPSGRAESTLTRLVWLNSQAAKWELYESAPDSGIGSDPVIRRDPADIGNLKTQLPPLPKSAPGRHSPEQNGIIELMDEMSDSICAGAGPDGLWSWSVNGLVFARETAKGIVFGCGRAENALQPETEGDLRNLVRRIRRYRHADSPDMAHPLYRAQPERWMESLLRKDLGRLRLGATEAPVYEQVPVVSGTTRGLLDLLTTDAQGRLVVIELKASEDLQLPLQALDYWMRVHWHHERGEIERGGYFHGRALSVQPPLLLLVSPALQFHPGCETILRYLSPQIECVRIGLNENWREEVKVVTREEGSPCPRNSS